MKIIPNIRYPVFFWLKKKNYLVETVESSTSFLLEKQIITTTGCLYTPTVMAEVSKRKTEKAKC